MSPRQPVGTMPVAIIGAGVRFPGAEGVDAFWDLLAAGQDAVREVPPERTSLASVASGAGGPLATRSAGFLDGVDLFDARLFGISPREAEVMDPQQRLMLEVAWQAFEDAAIAPDRLRDAPVGVFVGVSNADYARILLRDPLAVEAHGVTGSALSIVANRLSYLLDLRGPSLAVDTACSASLTALHLACQSLRAGECELALCGGVNLILMPDIWVGLSRAGMMAPDGRCKTFSGAADGYGRGEGAAALVLKPLHRALADGDPIRCVVRGSALNQDGASNGLTAPNPKAQEAVLRAAYASAGINPASVRYIEAHGTGTLLGDPIEVKALASVLGEGRPANRSFAIGSVKSNIGHLEAAAGIAGVLKTALALEKGQIPPSLHAEQLNRLIPFDRLPVRVQTRLGPWPEGDGPLVAGVSSFSFGGANAHAVLEAPPAPPPAADAPTAGPAFHLLTLSAASETSLRGIAGAVARHLEARPEDDLADVCHTLGAGRARLPHRLALVGGDRAALARSLARFAAEGSAPGVRTRHAPRRRAPKLVMMFTGQGAQYPGMARGLYDGARAFREALDRCAAVLDRELDRPLLSTIFDGAAAGEDESPIDRTVYTQPALFAVEYALTELWRSWGVRPDAVIGHSVGEYVAACVAGAIDLEDALRLIAERGRLMQALPAGGAMASVSATPERVERAVAGREHRLAVAAVNGPESCTIAGDRVALERALAHIAADGIEARRLPVSHAFHSPLLDPMLDALESAAARVRWRPLALPLAANLTGTILEPGATLDAGYWRRHSREPVRFADGVAALLRSGARLFLEVGPKPVLCGLGHGIAVPEADDAPPPEWLPSLQPPRPDAEAIRRALGDLYLHGVAIDWGGIDDRPTRRRLHLPTYVFDRRRYWYEPAEARLAAATLAPQAAPNSAVAPEPAPQPERISETRSADGPHPPTADAAGPSLPRPSRGRGGVGDGDGASRNRVLRTLQEELARLLRCDPAEVDPDQPLIEMGADSIVLVDAIRSVERLFGVRLAVRQFFEEYSTLARLAEHLNAVRPPEPAPVEPAAPPPAGAPRGIEGAAARDDGIEGMLRRQTELLQRMLAEQQAAFARLGSHPPAPRQRQPMPAAGRAGHLPAFRPAQAAASRLTPRQRAHIEALTRRYNAKTATSKRYADEARPVLADSRASAGFRFTTKELLYPIVSARSAGSRIWDVDGNEFLDITMGFGVQLFGHSPPFVQEAIARQLEAGIQLGPQSGLAAEVARLVCELTGMRRVAFCASGTEAVMTALRLARTVTGRPRVALFEGSYHGHFDGVLGAADPATAGATAEPVAPGITAGSVADLMVLEYGSPEALDMIARHRDDLAAVLVEPVQSRRPDLQPAGFLRELRRLTAEAGIVLIFDEMITGFRIHPGGAQAWFGIEADLATYGKIVGGGLPIGVIAGRGGYLDALDGGPWRFGDDSYPGVESTFFAGTFAKHPLAMAAAHAVLTELKRRGPALQEGLNALTGRMADELTAWFEAEGVPMSVARFGSLFRFKYYGNLDLFFFHLLDRGVFVWEGRNCFLSTAHDEADVRRLIEAVQDSVHELRAGGFIEPRRRVQVAATSPAAFPLADAQRQLWALAQISEEGRRAYNVPVALELSGPLDVDALEVAYGDLFARHGALRTRFARDGSGQAVDQALRLAFVRRHLSGAGEAALEAALAEAIGHDFDLAAGPLAVAELIRLDVGRHVLVLVQHHLIADGLSVGLMLDELSQLYAARLEGRPAGLPPAPGYRAFGAWHREHRDGPAMVAAERFWLDRFADGVPSAELRTDRPRPMLRRFRGGRRALTLDADLTASLRTAGRRQGLTLFMTVLGGFALLLHRVTGQDDLVIGLPTAGRPFEEAERLVGYCTHLLPLRSTLPPGGDAAAFLGDTRRALLDALEHDVYPFARLVERLAPRRDPARPPLVSVTFNLDRARTAPAFPGLSVALRPVPVTSAKFDLGVNVTDLDDRLLVEADFDADLFDARTVDRLLEAYRVLLGALAAAPETPVAALPLVALAERARLLDARPVQAAEGRIERRFAERAAARPDALAVVSADGALTYGELNARADRLARVLRVRGAERNAPVALLLPPSAEIVVALLAALKAGAGFLPIDPEAPAERKAMLVADSGARLALAHRPHADLPVPVLDPAEAAGPDGGDGTDPIGGPADLAYVLYTSGSTGVPKGVAVEHRQVLSYVEAVAERLALPDGAAYGMVSTFAADLGYTMLFPALLGGGTLVVATREEAMHPAALARRFAANPPDALKITPSHLAALLAGPEAPAVLPRRVLVCGGEPLPAALVRRVRALAPGLRVLNHYGPTEATVGALTYELPPGAGPADDAPIPLGRPLANARAYLLDRGLEPVPPGLAGEIVIGGAGVARGYVGRPDLTERAFLDDPHVPEPGARIYRTGDLGRLLPDGTIAFLGRRDEQVKVRGFRVEPGEVAAALRALPDVADAAVVVRHDGDGPERLVAYAVATPGGAPDPADLRAALARTLPDYMVPATVLLLEALPLTPNGKLDRNALPAPPSAGRSNAAAAEPRNEVEATLLDIWRSVLNRPALGIADNFFEHGGDSIQAIQVVSRADSAGLAFRPGDLFAHPTVEDLARVAEPAPATRAEQGPVTGPVELTPIQRWFLDGAPADPHHWNMSLLLEAPAAPDIDRLGEAVAALVERHDALRLRFLRDGDGWLCENAPAESCVPLSIMSIDGLDDAALRAEADAVQASLDLAAGPLVRFALFDGGAAAPGRLLIVAHHLVMDGVSWRILLDDLNAAWVDLSAGRPVAPRPKTTSFRDWAARLAGHAAALAERGEAKFWRRTLADAQPDLPRDDPEAPNLAGDADVLSLSLDEAHTEALLHAAPAAYGVGVHEALLAALAEAVNRRGLLVELEGHGREPLFDDVDLGRTVGWFTTHYPAWLDLGDRTEPGAALIAVKEALRAVPGNGIGFGLLRYLAPDPELRQALAALPRPEVIVNYLGRADALLPSADAAFRPAAPRGVVGWGLGREHGPRGARCHALEVEAMVSGGRLRIDLVYGTKQYRPATIAALGERLVAALARLARHVAGPGADAGALSPSDFPLARLTAERLERIVARLAPGGPPRRAIQDLYPLSPVQEGMLYHALAAPGSGIYVEQKLCRLDGPLDPGALERAWRDTVAAHPSLRTAFVAVDGDAPLQAVMAHAPFALDRLDWRHLSPAEQRERLDALVERDAAAGFTLERAPLMRLRLVHTGDGAAQMLWSHHHLIMDGWSTGLIFREVLGRYRALLAGQPFERPSPPYRGYIAWLARQDHAAAERFWRDALAGFTVPTPLGVDRLALVPEGAGLADHHLRLPESKLAALEALARRTSITLSTLVQAAWALLLSRYSAEPEVAFGVTVAGRPPRLAGADDMVGNFINVLPLRLAVDEDRPLPDWLGEVRSRQSALLDYGHSALVDIRRWAGVPGDVPLFQSAVVFENYPFRAAAGEVADGLCVADLRAIERNNLPLTLVAEPGPGGLDLTLSYDRALLDYDTVARLGGHLATLLESMLARPDAPLRELEMLTAPERDALAGPLPPQPRPERLVHERIAERAAAEPDRVALRFGGAAVTYGDLNRRANRFAHGLLALPVPASDSSPYVAVLLETGAEQMTAILAVLKAGRAFVALDPDHPPERLAFILEETRPAAILTDAVGLARQRAAIEALQRNHGCVPVVLDAPDPRDASLAFPGEIAAGPRFASGPDHDPAVAVAHDAPAYAVYTSGSTGRPKGIVQPHGAFAQIVDWHVREFCLGVDSRVAQWATVSYDASYGEIFPALVAGAALHLAPHDVRRNPRAAARWLARERITWFQTVPSFLREVLLVGEIGRHALAGLDSLLLAGEALTVELAREARAALRLDAALYNLYGPTECFLATFERIAGIPPGQRVVPVGRAIDGRQVLVLDARGRPCPVGVRGEVFVRSPFLASAYLERPEETAERFVPDPLGAPGRALRVGDLAHRLPDGRLEFCGRRDGQVKLRGMRVELGEIDAALVEQPGIEHAVTVVHRVDPAREPMLAAYVTGAPTAFEDIERLRAQLRRRLPPHMVPAAIIPLPALPRLPNGKVDRSALPAPDAAAGPADPAGGARSALEALVGDVFAEVFGHPVGRHDNFFEIGGHSLLAARVVNALRARGREDVPLRAIFEAPSVAALAARLEDRRGEARRRLEEILAAVERLSDEQVRGILRA